MSADPADVPQAAAEGGTRLADLSDDQVLSLSEMLDKVRETPQGSVLRREILDRLRPRLRLTRPPRPLTLMRLLCLPFEDLLFDGMPGDRPGLISRAAIPPAWALVERGAEAATLGAMKRDALPLTMRDRDVVAAFGRRLWPIAAEAIATRLAEAGRDRDARGRLARELGGEALVDDLAEIGGILAMAERVEQMRATLFPKPVVAMDEEMSAKLAGMFAAAAAEPPEQRARLARVAMARIAEPVDLIEAMPGDTGAALRVHLVADMERDVAVAARAVENPAVAPDPVAVTETAEAVVHRVVRLREMSAKSDGDPALRRLIDRVGTMVKAGVVEGSQEAILRSIKTAPGVAKVADTGTAVLAEERALSLKRCEKIAGTIGIATDLDGAVKQAAAAAEKSATQLIADLKAALARQPAAGGPEGGAAADPSETGFYRAVRLLEILVGPDRADKLRLQGEAAMTAALAAAGAREAGQPA